MARRFIKSVLHAGRDYHSPDGVVRVTRERLKRWKDGFAKLSAAKYIAPVDWDHADTAEKLQPVRMSDGKKKRSAANSVGKLAGFELAADGSHAIVEIELTDPKAQGRAERNEVYVSPVIMERWKDGHGTEYRDLITHVDLVNHPVDHSQGPFIESPKPEPGTVALAIRMGLGKPSVLRMGKNPFGKDDEEDDDGDSSGDSGNPFAKDGDGDGVTGEGSPAESPAESPPMGTEADNPDMPPKATDKTKLAAVVAGLGSLGIVLPSDFDFSADGSLDIMLAALNTLIGAQQQAEAEEQEQASEEEDKPMQVADPGYAAMSLFAERQHRDTLTKRLESLLDAGQCTPAEAEKFKGTIGTIKLSLDGTGKQLDKSTLETFIEHREAVPRGTFWDSATRTAKLSLEEVKPPRGMDRMSDELTEDEIQERANWALGRK
jgi:hypothetical protein